jgi:glycosyltransferase involved in cell wall biosynthesis
LKKDAIIHIITRLEPGGSTQNTIASCEYQSKDYRVILIAGAGFKPKEKLSSNIEFISLPSLSRELCLLKDIKAFKDIYTLISTYKPKIVHTHTSKAGILGRWAAAFYNWKNKNPRTIIVHTPHGHVFYGYFGTIKTFIFKQIEIFTAKLTDYFIALTEGEKRESISFGIGNIKKWSIIHSGIKFGSNSYLNPKSEFKFTKDEIIIGTVARLEHVKGVEYFIRAAEDLIKKNLSKKIKFLVVGNGELKEKLIKLSLDKGLEGKIIFTGFREDVYNCMAAMDIYIQPSLNEAMGRTIIQAQYMKLPIIASKVCGIVNLIQEGKTGFLIMPKDYKALANAAEILIEDEAKRYEMGKNAKKFMSEKDYTGYTQYSEESMNIKLKDLYGKL